MKSFVRSTNEVKVESSPGTNAAIVQPKLTVGSPGDAYEKEADTVADQVMRMPAENFVQRKCANCDDEEKISRKPMVSFIQRRNAETNNVASEGVSNAINATKGKDSSIDPSTRSFMETRFGNDFSRVRIHTGDDAIQMSSQLNAQAFTTGNDIYFNSGKYAPGSESGKHLLAHELTHTIQQGNDKERIQRWAIAGNTATSDSNEDYLGRLAIKAGASFNDWKCIKPLKMKTSELAKPPADFNDHYEKYVQVGDQFDISNLNETTGPALKLYLFDDTSEKMDADLVKLFYPGSSSSSDVDTDIDVTSDSGKKPISSLLIFGHAGGSSMWGNASSFTPGGNNPEEPKQSHALASAGLFPRRCWLTRNVVVRSVGCNSEEFGVGFAKAYLRKGGKITTTTASVRPKCSASVFDAANNVCKSYDGLDFSASFLASAAALEGPFWTVAAFHGGSYWKEIDGKL